MSNYSRKLRSTIAATITVCTMAAFNPAAAAEGQVLPWFEAQQQALAAAFESKLTATLESKLPVTFKFVGSRVIPVFITAQPRMRFVAIGAETMTQASQ
jgi:hypothetical protein